MKAILIFLFLIPIFLNAQKTDKEPTSHQDNNLKTLFTDNLYVQGQACIGTDCVDNEFLGDDTQRLKQNNTRIHFDDTSNSSAFPNNDWRIIINDDNDGGTNYFAIEDATAAVIPFRVEAGAPVNALYVEEDGDVGIKTANPVVDLHIVEGNTPTIRVEQDGSDGFTQQTWDVAGNEANFFVRDVTNGSKLPFKIKPNAPTDALYVAANGNIGLTNSNPQEPLHIRNAAPSIRLEDTDTGVNDWSLGVDGAEFKITDITGGTAPVVVTAASPDDSFFMDATGNIGLGTDAPLYKLHVVGDIGKTGSIYGVSDSRIKRDVATISNALALVNALDGKSYNFKSEAYKDLNLPEGKQYGLIAQEVGEVVSDIVTQKLMETTDKDGNAITLKGVNYEQLIPILINAIKEQDMTINSQQLLIKELVDNSKKTVARLDALERLIPVK